MKRYNKAMKKIAILGSTGSIGTQALDVIRNNPDLFRASVLSCAARIGDLEKQIAEFRPDMVCVAEENDAKELAKKYRRTEIVWGGRGLITAASSDCDVVLNSLVGIRGLEPTYNAILAGNDIALANKETLVAGGELIMKTVAERGVSMLPVDSEHSAIFQCLQGSAGNKIRRILLTASGGPFFDMPESELSEVTVEQALAHPNWSMGNKITIDSATMMNKGFEVIEAKWLFGVDLDRVEVLVHRQSILHSAVEFEDGAVIAQLGVPDMRLPIKYALTYPARITDDFPKLDFCKEGAELTFEKPDIEKFKCLKLAYEAAKAGGSYTIALNGANEVLVQLFLEGKIKFTQIPETLERILDSHVPQYGADLETILAVDKEVRRVALSLFGIGE